MDDLAAFIAARLDEDEAAAREAARYPTLESGEVPPWDLAGYGEDGFGIEIAEGVVGITIGPEGLAAHIARHEPARVLREVAVKRAIAGWHPSKPMRYINASHCPPCELSWPCPTIRFIAAVWSDHPDYRAEWKP